MNLCFGIDDEDDFKGKNNIEFIIKASIIFVFVDIPQTIHKLCQKFKFKAERH